MQSMEHINTSYRPKMILPQRVILYWLVLTMIIMSNMPRPTFCSLKIGTHDEKICKRQEIPLSCIHQLHPNIKDSSSCEVEYIPPAECMPYDVEKVYEPFQLPFILNLYQFRKSILHNLSFNISFPSPSWHTMSFHIRNQQQPNVHLCRKFHLENKENVSFINETLFWDCLLFNVNSVEENSFHLFLEDEKHSGGSYSFRVPSLMNFNTTTNINDWHVFFYIHHQYLQSTGYLYVTLQPAPFPDVSYSISLVECLSFDGFKCEHTITVDSVNLTSLDHADVANSRSSLTVRLQSVAAPGLYAVTVEILSDRCEQTGCTVSLSPVYEIKRSYKVEIACVLLALLILMSVTTYFVIHKVHQNFFHYINSKQTCADSVLLCYHVHRQEYLELIRYLAFILQTKFSVQPQMVDENAGMMNPDEWTRHELIAASKVLFIVPCSMELESVTPVQHQWLCATKYFSGTYLKRRENISKHCAAVFLPNSLPLAKGSEIYSLPRFRIPGDLVALADWLHRTSVSDRLFIWPSVVKDIRKDLLAFINYSINPSVHSKPDVEPLVQIHNKVTTTNGQGSHKSSNSTLEEESDNERMEKIETEFDTFIPNVRDIDSESDGELSSEETTTDNDSLDIHNYID